MPRFIALLRGINVGKAKRVPMAELRTLLADLGYTNVTTLLNSGNAVFDAAKGSSSKLAADITAAINDQFKIDVPVVVKSAKELATIISENPIKIGEPEHSRFLVAFVRDAKSLTELKAVRTVVTPPERFLIGANAAYLHCPKGILKSTAWEALLGKAGKSTTTRNWATVLKLHALCSEKP